MTLAVAAGAVPFALPLRRPLRTARSVLEHRSGQLLWCRGATGAIGWGEVAPLPGWSTVSAEEAAAQIRTLVDPFAAERWADPSGLAPEVRAGVDVALADLAAREQGLPLWRLLGARSGAVEVNALLGGSTPDALRRDATEAAAAGYRVVKLKAGVPDDDERVGALADAVGDHVLVRLDANRAWTAADAVAMLGRCRAAGLALELVEDPVADLDTLAACRGDLGAPVAVDELVRTAADLDRVVAERLADVVVVKPALVGGLGPAAAMAARARAAGLGVVVTSLYDTAIGLSAWAALAARFPGRAHGLATSALLARDVCAPPAVSRGVLQLSDAPGLGIVPDDRL